MGSLQRRRWTLFIRMSMRGDIATFDSLKMELLDLGCSLPINQSDLYKMDEITIRLD